MVQIPGEVQLIGKDNLDRLRNVNLILIGKQGSGKTMYSRQFLLDAFEVGSECVYINSSVTQKEFESLFLSKESSTANTFHFVNPYLLRVTKNESFNSGSSTREPKLVATLLQIETLINKYKTKLESKEREVGSSKIHFCLVLDSITHLLTVFSEEDSLKFINDLVFMLKEVEGTSIFTVTGNSVAEDLVASKLSSVFDGILEVRHEDANEERHRKIRLSSLRGFVPKTRWTMFDITQNGEINFVEVSSHQTEICGLCKMPILSEPEYFSEMAFHSKHLEIYKKLVGAYGQSRISDVGPSGVVDAHFFFVDIVGLSDPSLSVRKQIEKIEALNLLIGSCSTFKAASEKKVLPTGDGMVIAFMLNPELPLKLGTELHNEIRKYNENVDDPVSRLGIRIGLASGPVYIVNDINNNQNIWGPGIILARRVMDMGDNGHILIAGGLAEGLLGLDERYEKFIKFIGTYEAKHGLLLKIYSAYSENFGNIEMPKNRSFG